MPGSNPRLSYKFQRLRESIRAAIGSGELNHKLPGERELARREINEVHVECGARLAGALLRAGLLDELIVYLAPLLLGDSARGLFHLPGLASMSERVALEITDIRAVGHDWRISARPQI